MKKLLILLLLAATLSACNNQQHSKSSAELEQSEINDHHEATAESLTLNNGAKWKVDISTSNNVKNLQDMLKNFDHRNDRSVAAYKMLQEDLQHGIDKMITECKMKGPDHEALHKWLEPFMTQVSQLKHASNVSDAATALKGIELQANLYNQYFEL